MMYRVALPFEQWPEQYRIAWQRATGPVESLFDEGSAAARLRPQSVVTYRIACECWLGFLDRYGWLDDPTMPAVAAITRERLDAYVAEQRTRGNGNAVIKKRLVGLHQAVRLMWPGVDLGFIRHPGGVSLDRALPSTPRRASVRDSREVLDRACQLYREGCAVRSSACGRRAIRDAAIIGLLAFSAPRVGSLAAMRLQAHLIKSDNSYWIWLGEDDTKTGVSNSYPIDAVLTPILDDYINRIRPLFGGNATSGLWLGTGGTVLHVTTIGYIVRQRTKQWFGEGRGPHWLRKCLTTTAIMESPELALDVARLLGHGPEVSLRNYNLANASGAMRRFGKLISAKREATRGLATEAFTKLDFGHLRQA
ncbi:MAG: site-specific integrase [Acetobacteraceae bacterium]|nr:site-specific integrase [Acetobacteraceae bacterium]